MDIMVNIIQGEDLKEKCTTNHPKTIIHILGFSFILIIWSLRYYKHHDLLRRFFFFFLPAGFNDKLGEPD